MSECKQVVSSCLGSSNFEFFAVLPCELEPHLSINCKCSVNPILQVTPQGWGHSVHLVLSLKNASTKRWVYVHTLGPEVPLLIEA